ncbi:MAG: FCD domain-containing protein [Alphaproteobacteria bacterium]|nr:FCD domain-containing protein [Alphaproteobacteria bacterium]
MPSRMKTAPDNRSGGPTIATSVYDRIRRDIISGALAPGHKLGSTTLRERYQAGISPVREALNRLVAENLVCFEDQKGFHVAGIGAEDLDDLIRTRCHIEEIALRESIANGDDAWEDGIVVAFHRLSKVPRSAAEDGFEFNPEWEELHHAFHTAILAGCGSPRIQTYCELLADQAKRYRQLAATISYPHRNERDEHQDIMDAVIARDVERAVALHHAHLKKTNDIIVRSGLSLSPERVPA